MENLINDWLVVNVDLPNATSADLTSNGINVDNTVLKDREFYKSTKMVQKMFTDPNTGKFNEEVYNKYYDALTYSYNNFSDENYREKAMNDVEYHPFNDLRPEKGRVMQDLYKVTRAPNPYKLSMGMKGVNTLTDPKYSARELAQMNNVVDSTTGEVLDWAPNDDSHTGFFDFIYKNPTLVLAQYDEDGTHYDPFQGREVSHKKGDLKTNEKGFYYETLGTREAYNRQVLSVWDTLTKEGTWINDYDYMESDGLDKSIAGTVAKTVTKLAPLVIPGFGQYYGLALAGLELGNVMPMIAKAGIGLFAGDSQQNEEYWKRLNKVQGFSRSLYSNSVSDQAMNSMVNIENFGQLIVDVVGQLKTQQGIASIPSMIGMSRNNIPGAKKVYEIFGQTIGDKMRAGSLNALEKAQILEKIPEAAGYINRIVKNIEVAKALATTYMAVTSAAQISEEAKALGLDERDTAALYIGTSLGFFGMMRALPIGEWAIKGIGLDDAGNIMGKVIKEKASILGTQGAKLVENVTKTIVDEGAENSSKILGATKRWNTALIAKGRDWGKSIATHLENAEGYAGGAWSEAAEEISEEAMQDGIKNVYNGLNAIGLTSSEDKQFQFGDIKTIAARYAMAGFGGAVGGVVFHLGQNLNVPKNEENSRNEEMIIRNHGIEGMLAEVDKWENKGILSKTLSFETSDIITPSGQKKTVFVPTTDYTKSQNAIVANMLRDRYKRMQYQIFQAGAVTNVALASIYDDRADALVKTSANSPLFDDYDSITSKILKIRSQIEEASTVTATPAPEGAEAEIGGKSAKISQLMADLKVQQELLEEIHSGKKFADYQSRALFNIQSGYDINSDPDKEGLLRKVSISEPFVEISMDAFSMATYGQVYNKLNELEKPQAKIAYEAFKSLSVKDKLSWGFKRFTEVNTKASLDVQEMTEYVKALKEQYAYLPEEEVGSVLIKPTQELLKKVGANKNELISTTFKDNIINIALNPHNEAYTLSNRLLALDSIENLLNSAEKVPYEIIADLRKGVDSFTFKEVLPTNYILNTRTSMGDFDEELNDYIINYHTLEAIDNMFANGDASAALVEEVNNSKLSELEFIYNKYVKLIENSSAEAEIKTKSKQSLDAILENIKNLPSVNLGGDTEIQVTVQSIIDKQNYLNKLMESKSINMVKDLLNRFELKVNGNKSSILDLIAEEFATIAKLEEITEYEINDPNVFDNLEYSKHLLRELKSLIIAATDYNPIELKGETFGYNSTMNKTYPDVQLGVIGQGDSALILNELGRIEARINFLTELAKINSEDKIKNQRESGMIMESLFYDQLTDNRALRIYLDSIKVHGEPFMNDEIRDAISKADLIRTALEAHRDKKTNLPTTPSGIEAYEKQVIDIQLALHKRFMYFVNKGENDIKENRADVLNAIYGVGANGEMSEDAKKLFPPIALTHGRSTSFSSTETVVQPLDLFVWFNTTILTNPIDFVNHLRGSIGEDGLPTGIRSSAYAPFYSQEYAAKVIYTFLTNSDWINGATSLLSSKGGFLPNVIKPFLNAVFVDGRPGSGKSTGVVQHIARMLEEDGIDFWVAAAFKEKAQELDVAFNKTAKGVFDKDEILLKILNGNSELLAKVQDESNFVKRVGKYNEVEHTFFNLKDEVLKEIFDNSPKEVSNLPSVIFIDEITHFSMAELTAINIALSKMEKPPLLILMGDTRQNGYLYQQDRHNVNLFNFWKTPKLSASIRNSNNLKKKNLDNVSAFYQIIENKYLEADITPSKESIYPIIISDIKAIASDDTHALKFVQHTSNTGKVFGEKIINKNELSLGLVQTLAKNLSPNKKLGFITDNINSDIVKKIKAEPTLKNIVVVLGEKEVQGREFEDVIVDIDWTKHYNSEAFAPLTMISNIYTFISRSESGTVIVDNGLTSYDTIPIKREVSESVYDTKLDKTLVDQFKQLRSDILDHIVEDPEYKNYISDKNVFNSIENEKNVSMPSTPVITDLSGEDMTIMGMIDQDMSDPNESLVSKDHMDTKNLVCYPYYERLAYTTDNEDGGYLKSLNNEEFDDSTIPNKLMAIKRSILYSKDKKKLASLLSFDDDLEPNRAKLVVLGSRYDSTKDRSYHKEYDPKKAPVQDSPFLRVALEVPKSDGSYVYFTIAVFGSVDSVRRSNKQVLLGKLMSLEDIVATSIKTGDVTSNIRFEITDPEYINNITPSTNLQFKKLNNDEAIGYREFKEQHKDALISDPYIMTKSAPPSLKNSPLLEAKYLAWVKGEKGSSRAGKGNLAGSACCYISYDPSFKNPDELREAYENERIQALRLGKKAPIPKVKMMILDLKYYEPMDWFRATNAAISKAKSEDSKIVNPMATMASPAIAGRLLNVLISIHQKAPKDSNTYRYLNAVLNNLALIFKFEGDNKFKELQAYISGNNKHIKNFFGGKAEIAQHYFSKETGEPVSWQESSEENKKNAFINFDNNQLYKLMVAINVAMFGGVVNNPKYNHKNPQPGVSRILEIKDAMTAANIQVDQDILSMIEASFNTLFKEDPYFTHGIKAHAVYNKKNSTKASTEGVVQAAWPAFDNMDFVLNRTISLPNILLNLDNIKTTEEAVEQKNEKILEKHKELISLVNEGLKVGWDYIDSIDTQGNQEVENIINDFKSDTLVDLASTLNELESEQFDPNYYDSYEDYLIDYDHTKETIKNVVSVLAEVQNTIQTLQNYVPPSLKTKTDAQILEDLNKKLPSLFEKLVGEATANIEIVTPITKKNDNIHVEAMGHYDNNDVKMSLKITSSNQVQVVGLQTIPHPVEVSEAVTLMKKHGSTIQKMLADPKSPIVKLIEGGVLSSAVNLNRFINNLLTGNIADFNEHLVQEPEYLSIFIATQENEIVDDLTKILNKRDTNCFFAIPF